jgi:hypothetical protein
MLEGNMPYQKSPNDRECTVCRAPANARSEMMYTYVDCSRCGDFQVDRTAIDDIPLPLTDIKKCALASYAIRNLQGTKRPILTKQMFDAFFERKLPTPVELSDNLLQHVANQVDGQPGKPISIDYNHDVKLLAFTGAVDQEDVLWAVRNLVELGLLKGQFVNHFSNGYLTATGWQRVEELKRSHISSKYAFFARRFDNADLDKAYNLCLRQAVEDTGYELRLVTQKAGNIDAIIEDEIRRCRFLIADLTDQNAGAYWEAGFAEGLGKDVIYICREGVKTHFDTDHRQTVRWDLSKLEETARQLKAVIRNTLLGDAQQADD